MTQSAWVLGFQICTHGASETVMGQRSQRNLVTPYRRKASLRFYSSPRTTLSQYSLRAHKTTRITLLSWRTITFDLTGLSRRIPLHAISHQPLTLNLNRWSRMRRKRRLEIVNQHLSRPKTETWFWSLVITRVWAQLTKGCPSKSSIFLLHSA
jgi:hypothetical protein